MVADLTRSVVLIDKPAGPTSFVVARCVARTLGFKRAGHTGTLDSNVTGVLVVAIEEATKGISQLVGLDKGYEGQMKFSRPISDDELRAACACFVGRIAQMPPEKCAVKRRLRLRTVHSFDITGLCSDGAGGTLAEFSVEVEAGTYVRTLVADLGEKLGCRAELVSLRRTHVGPFRLDECVALDRLGPEHAIYIVEALERVGLKKVVLTPEQIRAAQRGMPVAVESAPSESGKMGTGTIFPKIPKSGACPRVAQWRLSPFSPSLR